MYYTIPRAWRDTEYHQYFYLLDDYVCMCWEGLNLCCPCSLEINIILRKLQLMLNSNISLDWMIFENFNWISSSWFFTNISNKRKEIIKIHFWRTLYIVSNVHYCQCCRYDIWRILGIWNIYLEKEYNNVRKYIAILRCNLISSSVTLRSFLVQNSVPWKLSNTCADVSLRIFLVLILNIFRIYLPLQSWYLLI